MDVPPAAMSFLGEDDEGVETFNNAEDDDDDDDDSGE